MSDPGHDATLEWMADDLVEDLANLVEVVDLYLERRGWHPDRMVSIDALTSALAGLDLYDDTDDPHDAGYMTALIDVRAAIATAQEKDR